MFLDATSASLLIIHSRYFSYGNAELLLKTVLRVFSQSAGHAADQRHDSIEDLALLLSYEVICNQDKSTMVEELSGVCDSPPLIVLTPKFSRSSNNDISSSSLIHQLILYQLNAPCKFRSNRLDPYCSHGMPVFFSVCL